MQSVLPFSETALGWIFYVEWNCLRWEKYHFICALQLNGEHLEIPPILTPQRICWDGLVCCLLILKNTSTMPLLWGFCGAFRCVELYHQDLVESDEQRWQKATVKSFCSIHKKTRGCLFFQFNVYLFIWLIASGCLQCWDTVHQVPFLPNSHCLR